MLSRLLLGPIVLVGLLGIVLPSADDDTSPIKIRARYEIEPTSRTGRIVVDCEMPEGNHIYSLQQSSPPGPTKIQIAKSDQYEVGPQFVATRQPEVIERDPIFETRLEQFSDKISFAIPIQLAPTADAEKLEIAMTINCQVCSDTGCVLVRNKKFVATFGGFVEPEAVQKWAEAAKETVERGDKLR